MYYEKRGEGKYNFIQTYSDPITGLTKRCSVVLFTDKPDGKKAQAAARQVLAGKIEDACAGTRNKGVTLEMLLRYYIDYQKQHVEPPTYLRNESRGKSLLEILGKDTLVNSLSAGYITKRFNEKGLQPSTYNELLVRMKAMFRWGYQTDYIDDISWLDKLRPVKDQEKKRKLSEKFMTKQELTAVLESMTVEKWKLLTEFLALSGLRIGELMALNDSDVTDEWIHVNKTYQTWVKRIRDHPKTDFSIRNVSVQPQLLECIRKMRDLVKEQKAMISMEGSLFYPGKFGDVLEYDAYRIYLERHTLKAIGRKLSPHALRHTMTCLFAAANVPLEVVTRRLGHSDARVTREIYLHVTTDIQNADAKACNIDVL